MKKSRINALLAAGAVALLAPNASNAADLGDITSSPAITEDSTFSTINAADGVTIQINTTAGSLTPNEDKGAVTMDGTSVIELSPAVNAVTFASTTANGTNSITQSSASTGTTSLGTTSVSNGAALTLTNNGGTMNAAQTSLNGSTVNIAGTGAVTFTNGVTVSGTGNIVSSSNI